MTPPPQGGNVSLGAIPGRAIQALMVFSAIFYMMHAYTTHTVHGDLYHVYLQSASMVTWW